MPTLTKICESVLFEIFINANFPATKLILVVFWFSFFQNIFWFRVLSEERYFCTQTEASMDDRKKSGDSEIFKKAITTVEEKKTCNPPISNSCVNLNLKPNVKFTVKHARTLDKHTLTYDELKSPDQIPDYILKTLMIANYHAREFKLKPSTGNKDKNKINRSRYDSDESEDDDENKTKDSDSDESVHEDFMGVNPMDGLLSIFHCSDTFLRRDLAIKLSACQLSVPFLLPDPITPSKNVTMMLSALENITKSWKGASCNKECAQEVFATEYPFPVVSFVRVGTNSISKSSLINKIMSDDIGDHNFFFHKNIKGGDVKRKVVDGLVELSWYLPGGSEGQTLRKEICFANLRGDARNFTKQLGLLLKISSVLSILLPSECPDENMTNFLKKATEGSAKVILIFKEKRGAKAKEYFNDLRSKHRGKLSLITSDSKPNEYDFLQSIRQKVHENINGVKAEPLVKLASCASEYDINIDHEKLHFRLETSVDTWLELGTKKAKSLLKLQTHVPNFAKLEREKFCPKHHGKSKRDVDEIYKDIEAEKEAQKESFTQLDERILHYLNCIAVMHETERNFALNEVKHQLDKMSLQIMANLHQEYRAASINLQKKKKNRGKSDARSSEEEHLKQLEESISNCSFGLEHVIRELAQLYQLPDITTNDYPGAAAEILLSGQPLELLDGDSSYIPLRWFNAVYQKLEQKTKNAKIFVISVLGIQSSGKSTMLNTMFGLEFPVSAGRCTRGAFASLITVSESLKSLSKLDYVLIIDTEGLRGSADPLWREHDNELATFAIGMADVTIVNIFGENHSEMKEFLEIAVHAFLKMKLVKEKKSCKIVHQNVAATDATDKLIVDRLHLKQDLDKMAKLAAFQENCEDKFERIDDIMSFDENEDVFYIPSLLKGSPPMAPVNPNYGRAVHRVKENIIALMCSKERCQLSVSNFRKRVTSLWNAMLQENFIFSFRNTIEVRAYTSLDRKYFEESVNLMVIGMGELERKIQVALTRCSTRDEREKQWEVSKKQIREEAEALREKMEVQMKVFFETSEDKATLEQWKENIMNKIEQLKENQLTSITSNCSATFHYLQNRQDVEEQTYEKELLQKAKKFIISAHNSDDAEKCKAAFKQEWKQWIVDVPQCQESKIDINDKMIDVLCGTSRVLNVEMTRKLKERNYSITSFKEIPPKVDISQLSISFKNKAYNFFWQQQQQVISSVEIIIDQAINRALDFARTRSKTGGRCTVNDFTQMYHKVIKTIDEETKNSSFKFSKPLKCDVLLYTFANAYKIFDDMEERYYQERDIRGELERNLQPKLETYFLNLCNEMEKEVLVATSVVDVLQAPIESELNKAMGPVVTGELLKISMYQSKGPFHASVLIQLGKEGKFEPYIPYLENPVNFLKNRLMESVQNYCVKQQPAIITLLLTNEAIKIKGKVFDAISTANKATKAGSKKLTSWIRSFVKNCSTLAITNEMFAVAAINEDLKEMDVFEAKVREKITHFLELLIMRDVNLATFQKWNPSPHEHLFTSMFGCQNLCPFCKGLCDQTTQNHVGNHSTRIHRPQCVTGYRYLLTERLATNICTTDVAGEDRFQNIDTSGEWHAYNDYQSVNDYYESWTIPPDPSFEASTYWQWFVATFSKELAEHYKAKLPIIPEAWKRLSFREVQKQLREDYNL